MNNMKVAAVVVWFRPDVEAVLGNIFTYIDDIDLLLVYKNSEIDNATINALGVHGSKIQYIGTGENIGIAAALNVAAEYAIDNNYTHLLTLDQDSKFPEGHLLNFLNLIAASKVPDVGIYCANPDNRGKLTFESTEPYIEVPDSITSGSIFPIAVFKRCGLFESDLFIDAVDYEYCFRIKSKFGLKTIVFPEIILLHEVGYPTKINLGLTTDNYSAFRTYFIVRNHIIIWKRYPDLFQKSYKVTLIKIHILYRLAKIMIGETDKFMKIKAILTGMVHGFKGKTGFYKL